MAWRKVYVLACFFAGIAFADEVKVEHYVEVSFPGEIWHNLDDDYYFRSPVNSSRCDSCFGLVKGDIGDYLFYSALDTNIFFIDGTDFGFSKDLGFTFWELSSAKLSVSDFLRKLFMRFQECGYIVISQDSLNDMLDTAVAYIEPYMQKKTDGIYEHHCYSNENIGPCIRGLEFYRHDSDELEREIARQNAAISAVPQRHPTVKDPLERYRLFDLNGRFIMNTNKVPYVNSRMYYAR